MSIKVSTLCWQLKLPTTAKFVLLRLADFANDKGSSIYPALETVAEDCCLSVRAVRQAFRFLEDTGILRLIEASRGGRGRTSRYAIDMIKVATLAQGGPGPLRNGHDLNPEPAAGYATENPEPAAGFGAAENPAGDAGFSVNPASGSLNPAPDAANPLESEVSEASASGQEAVPPEPPPSPTASPSQEPTPGALAWGPCLDSLGMLTGQEVRSLRPLVGKWCRDYGEAAVIEAVSAAAVRQPALVAPIPWIVKALQAGGASGHGKRNADKDNDALLRGIANWAERRMDPGSAGDGGSGAAAAGGYH